MKYISHFRYLGTFFIVCVLPAVILASRMDRFELGLMALLVFSSIVFFALADMVLIKNNGLSERWGYKFNPKAILGWWIFGVPFEEYVYIVTSVVLPIALWEFIQNLTLSAGEALFIGGFAILLLIVVSPFMHHLDA